MDKPTGCVPQRGDGRPLTADPVVLALAALGLLLVPWFLTGLGGAGSSWLIHSGLDLMIVVFAARVARLRADRRADRRFWRSLIIGGSACGIGDLYETVRVLTRPDFGTTKEVNDGHGHHAGDHVLVTVAQRLRELVGTAGLVARLGGDEFAVLLEAGVAQAAKLAERITVAVAAPIALADTSVTLGASVGVCVGLPGDADRILRDADTAMYRDKHERKAAA